MRCLLPAFVLAVSSLLAACGGGGGDAAPAEAVTFSVGGQLAGLGAGKALVLADASGPDASLAANGAYSLRLPAGTAYSLRVTTQPVGQTCTIANGSGTANADINNISVTCADDFVLPEAKPVSGTVVGLGAGKVVVLQLTADGSVQEATVSADGSFSFPQAITGTYTITVTTPPAGQACTIANAQGTAGEGAPAAVTCDTIAFKLSGTVSGNLGVVALRNAGNGETVTLISNGAFGFVQPILQGGKFSVAVFDQSASQTCGVANGSGTASADVSNIQVSCTAVVAIAPPPPVLVPSVPTDLTMTYSVKSFNLAWGTVAEPVGGGPVSYRLFEDVDGPGPAASTQIGGTLTSAAYIHLVTGLLHTRLNSQYQVQACNSAGCSAATAAATPNLTQAIGYFKASNTGSGDRFGNGVALSADGNTLAVGAPEEDSSAAGIGGNQAENSAANAGAVYVLTRNSTGIWIQQAYVKASNTGAGDLFGYSVALSSDGNTLAVGASSERSSATGIGGNEADNSAADAGAVYVFTRSGVAWSQQAYVKASNTGAGDLLGSSVALSGDGNTLAVGAYGEASNATGINGNQADNSATSAGAVYVFTRNSVSIWTQEAYVKASNTEVLDLFGARVALSNDGNTLAVGANGEDSNATDIDGSQVNNLSANSGAVYVFARNGVSWTQQAYVKASNTGAGDQFGGYVALSGDGNTMAVWGTREASNATGINGNQADNSSPNAGAVYVFVRGGITWTQQAYVKASNTETGDFFGVSIALSSDGNTLAVGAVFEDCNATGINGNQADNSASSAGAVYVFTRSGVTWTQQTYLKASNTGASDQFGGYVALSGDGSTLAVGARWEGSNATGINGNQADNSASQSGAVYLY